MLCWCACINSKQKLHALLKINKIIKFHHLKKYLKLNRGFKKLVKMFKTGLSSFLKRSKIILKIKPSRNDQWQNCQLIRYYATTTKKTSSLPKIKGKTKSKKTVDVDARTGYWKIAAFSTGDEYNIENIAKVFRDKEMFETTNFGKEIKNSDFLHAIVKQENGNEAQEVFVFSEGAVVLWNVSELDIEVLLSLVRKHQSGVYSDEIVREESELMNYTYGNSDTKTTLIDDDFCLEPRDDIRFDKYAISNAMAMSVKLGTWEASLARYIDSMEDVTDDLRAGNRIKMSQAEVMRKTGELFALRHAINLSSDFLDTPDIYWDREELEQVYQLTLSYFCISKRTRVINEKINHCIELVELLSSHLRDHHHVRLEWMIIILIMVEVLFELLRHIEDHNKPEHVNTIN